MSTRIAPALLAIIGGFGLTALLFVPFVARQYRRRGELRARDLMGFLAILVYPLALATYALTPFPSLQAGFCAKYGVSAQLVPLYSLLQLDNVGALTSLRTIGSDPLLRQVTLNVALFVPLGVFAYWLTRRSGAAVKHRQIGKHRIAIAAIAGFSTSLLLELTQLSGLWSVYPCAYRVFDVDDLLANTSGALIGAIASRMWPPSRPAAARDPRQPRMVTAERRLLALGCDVVLLWWLGVIALTALDAVVRVTDWRPVPGVEAAALWLLPALVLLLASFHSGNSLGQGAVLLRCGDKPSKRRICQAWFLGIGGLALTQNLLHGAGGDRLEWPLTFAFLAAHALSVCRTADHRGISGYLYGLRLVDARTT